MVGSLARRNQRPGGECFLRVLGEARADGGERSVPFPGLSADVCW